MVGGSRRFLNTGKPLIEVAPLLVRVFKTNPDQPHLPVPPGRVRPDWRLPGSCGVAVRHVDMHVTAVQSLPAVARVMGMSRSWRLWVTPVDAASRIDAYKPLAQGMAAHTMFRCTLSKYD